MYLISCLICILNAEKQSQETGAVGWADQPPTLRASERSGETGLAHKGHIAGAGGGGYGSKCRAAASKEASGELSCWSPRPRRRLPLEHCPARRAHARSSRSGHWKAREKMRGHCFSRALAVVLLDKHLNFWLVRALGCRGLLTQRR